MLHQSIETKYIPQKKAFTRMLRVGFSVAGVYWLFMYPVHWLRYLSENQFAAMKSGQMLIYFLLLLAWGVEYLREARRYKGIILYSSSHGILPSEISIDHIKGIWPSFAIIGPIDKESKAWLMPIINIVLITASFALIIRQYIDLALVFLK